MKNSLKFYRSKSDKSKFTISNGDLFNDDYIELKVNSADASLEKHIPVYKIENDKIKITVGSNLHPMSEEHYIMWIALVTDEEITVKAGKIDIVNLAVTFRQI